jgi:hypothetical protein
MLECLVVAGLAIELLPALPAVHVWKQKQLLQLVVEALHGPGCRLLLVLDGSCGDWCLCVGCLTGGDWPG